MKRFACLFVCLMAVGCGAVSGPANPSSPVTPVVKSLALAEITEALADSIPASIDNSDQLTLVLDDLVKVGKITETQSKQVKSALDNIRSQRALTKGDADRVRGVK